MRCESPTKRFEEDPRPLVWHNNWLFLSIRLFVTGCMCLVRYARQDADVSIFSGKALCFPCWPRNKQAKYPPGIIRPYPGTQGLVEGLSSGWDQVCLWGHREPCQVPRGINGIF